MKKEDDLINIIHKTDIPFFLLGASVFYYDTCLSNGTIVSVQPFLEHETSKYAKGYLIKILTEDGINHDVEVVKNHNGINVSHYFQNDKNLNFKDPLKVIYSK